MPDKADDIQRLVERIEGASGPDREIDAAIEDYLNPLPAGDRPRWPFATGSNLDKWTPRYSSSLDEAASLVPDHDTWWATSCGPEGCPRASVTRMADDYDTDHCADAVTPALALCAAVLRARITERTDDE